MGEVVAVPYGMAKAPAVRAALRSRLVDSLVTHTSLARALLDAEAGTDLEPAAGVAERVRAPRDPPAQRRSCSRSETSTTEVQPTTPMTSSTRAATSPGRASMISPPRVSASAAPPVADR